MNSQKKILSIANGIALVLTIAVKYLSNAGLLNGNTMKTTSDRYFNYLRPQNMPFLFGELFTSGYWVLFFIPGTTVKKIYPHPMFSRESAGGSFYHVWRIRFGLAPGCMTILASP